MNEKNPEEYEIDPYFYEHYKIPANKNGCEIYIN